MNKHLRQYGVRRRNREKLRGSLVTKEQLLRRQRSIEGKGFPPSKWIEFCIRCLDMGLVVRVHEAVTTRSKYVYLSKGDTRYKVRFSNHAANAVREAAHDSDFYVGVGNTRTTTTEDAIRAVRRRFFHEGIE